MLAHTHMQIYSINHTTHSHTHTHSLNSPKTKHNTTQHNTSNKIKALLRPREGHAQLLRRQPKGRAQGQVPRPH